MEIFTSSYTISAPTGLTTRRSDDILNSNSQNNSTTTTTEKGCVAGVSASILTQMEQDDCDGADAYNSSSSRLSHLQNIVECLSNAKKGSPRTPSFTAPRRSSVDADEEDSLIESFTIHAPPALITIGDRGGDPPHNDITPSCIEEDLRAYTTSKAPNTHGDDDITNNDDVDQMSMPPALLLAQLDPTSLSLTSSIHLAKWIAYIDHTRKVVALSELMEDQYLVTRGGGGGKDPSSMDGNVNGEEGMMMDSNNNTPAATSLSARLGVSSSMDNTVTCCGSNVFSILEGGGRSPLFGVCSHLTPTAEDSCRVLAPMQLVPSSFPGDEYPCPPPTPPSSSMRLPSNASSNVNTPRPPTAALLRRPLPGWAGAEDEEGGGGGVSPGMSELNASTCSVSTLACTTGSMNMITTPHNHHADPQHRSLSTSSTTMTSFIRRRRSSRNMLLPPSALVPRLAATQIENDCEISLLNTGDFGGEDAEGDGAGLNAVGVGPGGGGGWSPNWSFLHGRSPRSSGAGVMAQPNTTTTVQSSSATSTSRRLSGNPTLVNICVPASDGLSANTTNLHDSSYPRRSVNRQSRGRALSGSSRTSVDHPLFANRHLPSPVASDGSPLNTPRLPSTVGINSSVYHQHQQYLQAPSPTHPQTTTNNNHHQHQHHQCATFLENSLTSNDVSTEVGASILSSSGRRFSYEGNIPTNNGSNINFPPNSSFQAQKGSYHRSRGGSVRSANAWTTSGGTTPRRMTAANNYEDTTPSDGGLNQATTPVVVNLLHW